MCVCVCGLNNTNLILYSLGGHKSEMVPLELKSRVPPGGSRGDSVSGFLEVTCIPWRMA